MLPAIKGYEDSGVTGTQVLSAAATLITWFAAQPGYDTEYAIPTLKASWGLYLVLMGELGGPTTDESTYMIGGIPTIVIDAFRWDDSMSDMLMVLGPAREDVAVEREIRYVAGGSLTTTQADLYHCLREHGYSIHDARRSALSALDA